MINDPLQNLGGVSPTPAIPGYGPENVGVGGNRPEPKGFSLPQEPKEGKTEEAAAARPSPFDLAGESRGKQRMTPEEMTGQLEQLQEKFGQIHAKLQDETVTSKFTPDHLKALQQVTEKTNPDLRTIANQTGGTFQPPAQVPGESQLTGLLKWVQSSQQTFGSALDFLSNTGGQGTDVGSMFKLQYSMQRASQRTELFANIMGSTVSGIKTIMSTQVG